MNKKRGLSYVDPKKCIACGNCLVVCPYGALSMKRGNTVDDNVAETNPMLCKGCGICAAICPVGAITMQNFTDEQIDNMIKAALEELREDELRILVFLCNWCSYAGAGKANVSKFQYPPNIRIIRVMCSGRVESRFIYSALLLGADGVLVGGCNINNCHYIHGNVYAQERINGSKGVKKLIKDAGLEPERVKLELISASEGRGFAEIVSEFMDELKRIGPNPLKLLKIKNHY